MHFVQRSMCHHSGFDESELYQPTSPTSQVLPMDWRIEVILAKGVEDERVSRKIREFNGSSNALCFSPFFSLSFVLFFLLVLCLLLFLDVISFVPFSLVFLLYFFSPLSCSSWMFFLSFCVLLHPYSWFIPRTVCALL